MRENYEIAYERGARTRQLARRKAERAKLFAESYLRPKKPKSPFGAIKERMDAVKNRGIKQGIGAAAIKFRRKKKISYSAFSETETTENDAPLVPGQPPVPGRKGMLAPPAPIGPPPEPVETDSIPDISRGYEFPLNH